MHSTLRIPDVVDFPRCNIADIICYMRKPTDPPLVDPKVEILPQLCEEENATLELTFPMTVSFYTEMGSMYARIRVIPCMAVKFKMQNARMDRKGDAVPP